MVKCRGPAIGEGESTLIVWNKGAIGVRASRAGIVWIRRMFLTISDIRGRKANKKKRNRREKSSGYENSMWECPETSQGKSRHAGGT